MSNATHDSREPGDNKKRRRSRGGQNRRNNNQPDRRGGQRESNPNRGGQNRRSEEFRPQAPRPPFKHAPVKLSWWQKLLKAVGLYKEPVKPAREPRKESSEQRAPKSNTRNARTDGSEPREKRPDSERPAGKKRTDDRGERRERPDKGERRERSPRGGNPNSVESARVYVGNLSYDVSEQDLQELFKGIGGVRNVEIVYNRSTHRSKGYGFVEMLHVDEAKRAVEVLHDQFFMGRQMTVSGAKSKGQDDREDQEARQDAPARPVVVAPLTPVSPEPVVEQVEASAPAVEEIFETTSPIIEPAEPELASTDLVTPVTEEASEEKKPEIG